MKKYIISLSVFLFILLSAVGFGKSAEYESVPIYFVDSQMLRLVGVQTQIEKSDVNSQAKEVIKTLIEGHDDNKKIRRVLPKVKNGMTVKVFEGIAYVDIKEEMAQEQEKGRDIENLAIYSVVNSLTEIDGIKAVRFTIDGITREDYAGFVDMRDTFAYDEMY